jgi:phage terminase large subunit-like protein
MRPNAKATRQTGLRGAACSWLVGGLVVNGSWEGQWLSYMRVGGMGCGREYAEAVVYVQWLAAAVQWSTCANNKRCARNRGLGWAGTKGLLHVAMTRCAKGSQVLTDGRV